MSHGWNLEDALSFIRTQQPLCMQAGYYLALAGGVLNKGKSLNDLDLVAMPMTEESCIEKLLVVLSKSVTVTIVDEKSVVSAVHITSSLTCDKLVEIAIVKVVK